MKKVLLFFFMMCATMTAGAQGTWQKVINEADELRGQEAGEAIIYSIPQMGSFVVFGWDSCQFRLVSDETIFNTVVSSGYTGQKILVGIYDDNNKLIEKFEMWLDLESNTGHRFIKTRNAGYMSNPVGQKKKVKKIFKALQSDSGYVRIIAERYNSTDFDIKITPYKE